MYVREETKFGNFIFSVKNFFDLIYVIFVSVPFPFSTSYLMQSRIMPNLPLS